MSTGVAPITDVATSEAPGEGLPEQPTSPPVRRRSQIERHPVKFVILLVISIALLLPFAALAIKGLTPAAEVSSNAWFPTYFRWQNIIDALNQIPYFQFAATSAVIAIVYSGLTTFSSAMVGYGFARLNGPGKRVLFAVLIGLMVIPQIVTLIPTYLVFSGLGLIGTYWPWVFWGLEGAPYVIFLYRQFYASFPKELEEAARLDGAGRFRTFVSIFVPLSRPLMVTAFVISFTATWGDYIAPSLFLNASNTTLAVGLTTGYQTQNGILLPQLLAAGSFLYIIPVLVLFLFAQRSYVRGFVSSGIK